MAGPRIGLPTALAVAWSVLVAAVIGYLLANRHGVLWGHGLPVGHDFHIFYTAARAAADGRLIDIFVPDRLWAAAHEYLGVRFATNGLWLYPPHYLLLIAPLALLPYLASYFAFATATLAAYIGAAASMGLRSRALLALAIAPSTVLTIIAGQNGLLTGALIVPGVALMESRPYVAGLLFGALTIKPHLGLLVVVSLMAARAWRAAAAATVTATVLAAAATLVYGIEAWTLLFRETLPLLTRDVQTVAPFWATGLASVFPHAALVFGSSSASWILQIGAAAVAATLTYRVCRRSSDVAERAAVVATGTMLTFPYLFFYDLPMVTLATALYVQSRVELSRLDILLLGALVVTPLLVISGIPLLAPAVIAAGLLRLSWNAERAQEPSRQQASVKSTFKRRPASPPTPRTSRTPQHAGAIPASTARWSAVLIVAAVLVVYSNSLAAPFILDDEATIVANPAVRSFAAAITPPRDTPTAGRPVAALSFAMNYALGGLEVAGYHVVNVAIHAACALLVFGIVKRTLALPRLESFVRPSAGLALAIALLWAVHPLNTEAVTYITQRTESLMAFSYLLTLYAGIRSLASARAMAWQAVAVSSCLLGMGCKETMATAPVVVALYDRAFVYSSFGQALRERWRLYAGLALSWLVLAFLLSSQPRSGSTGFGTAVDSWTYLLNQAVMVCRYLRLAFWPRDLVVNYGPPVPLTAGDVWPYALVIAALAVLTVAAFRSKPLVGFLGVWLFATLAPASSIVPVATQAGAERRMYLPLISIVALVVASAYSCGWLRARVSRRAAALVLVILSVVLGTRTLSRNREYASPLVLAEATLRRWPTDVAHGMVGAELVRLQRDEDAVAHLRQGARSDPTARYNLGVALFNARRFDEAIRELEVLIARYPAREEVPWSRRLIGQSHAAQQRRPDAIAQFREVLKMTPDDSITRNLMIDTLIDHGVESATAGRHQDAIAAFRQGVALDSRNTRLRANLATALIDAGDPAAAAVEAQLAIDLNGADAVSHDLLGRALALQGRFDEAIRQFHRALEISPSDATIRTDLQRVLAVRGGRP